MQGHFSVLLFQECWAHWSQEQPGYCTWYCYLVWIVIRVKKLACVHVVPRLSTGKAQEQTQPCMLFVWVWLLLNKTLRTETTFKCLVFFFKSKTLMLERCVFLGRSNVEIICVLCRPLDIVIAFSLLAISKASLGLCFLKQILKIYRHFTMPAGNSQRPIFYPYFFFIKSEN